jgi:hypothetical protein
MGLGFSQPPILADVADECVSRKKLCIFLSCEASSVLPGEPALFRKVSLDPTALPDGEVLIFDADSRRSARPLHQPELISDPIGFAATSRTIRARRRDRHVQEQRTRVRVPALNGGPRSLPSQIAVDPERSLLEAAPLKP